MQSEAMGPGPFPFGLLLVLFAASTLSLCLWASSWNPSRLRIEVTSCISFVEEIVQVQWDHPPIIASDHGNHCSCMLAPDPLLEVVKFAERRIGIPTWRSVVLMRQGLLSAICADIEEDLLTREAEGCPPRLMGDCAIAVHFDVNSAEQCGKNLVNGVVDYRLIVSSSVSS